MVSKDAGENKDSVLSSSECAFRMSFISCKNILYIVLSPLFYFWLSLCLFCFIFLVQGVNCHLEPHFMFVEECLKLSFYCFGSMVRVICLGFLAPE